MMLGLDLGIRTGSLVQIKLDDTHDLIENYRVLYSWTKGPSIKEPVNSITEYFDRNVLKWLSSDVLGDDLAVAIDWNQHEINWSANRNHSNIKSFIAGYVMCYCHQNHLLPYFISPRDVRTFFGFKAQKTPKTEVQRYFLNIPTVNKTYSDLSTHDLDALILAYIMALKWEAKTCPV